MFVRDVLDITGSGREQFLGKVMQGPCDRELIPDHRYILVDRIAPGHTYSRQITGIIDQPCGGPGVVIVLVDAHADGPFSALLVRIVHPSALLFGCHAR